MGKQFEGATPTPQDLITAYDVLGLRELLGEADAHTFFGHHDGLSSEKLEVYCLPGVWSKANLQKLLRDAGLLPHHRVVAA